MIVQLKYLHEHMDEESPPENVWWDEDLCSFCTNDDVDNFDELFHLQFQIGGWRKKNETWLAQVGYGHPNERVILERRDKQQLHVMLKNLMYEDDEAQYWTFERVRSKNLYALPAPAEPVSDELSSAVGAIVLSEDAAAAADSRS